MRDDRREGVQAERLNNRRVVRALAMDATGTCECGIGLGKAEVHAGQIWRSGQRDAPDQASA